MSEKIQGRPWQPHEDALLLAAIHNTQGDIDWKIIAKFVPDRTNKACRKRWLHSLCPTVKKTAWTQAEDDTLLRLYGSHGPKWALIARAIPGRTDDACSKRYREALDPSLKRDEWTSEEDARLMELQASMRGKWGQIGPVMGRSGLGCRNRWRLLERKRTAGNRDTGAQAGLSGHIISVIEPQAGPSTLPPLHPPAGHQETRWEDDLLAWDTQYSSVPNSSYAYNHSQPDSTLTFYASDAGQPSSSNHYNMHSLPDAFGSEEFFAHMNVTQSQTTYLQSQQSSLQAHDYRAFPFFGHLAAAPVDTGPLLPNRTYAEAHNHDAQLPGDGAIPRRIMDSQIDPVLMHGFDEPPLTRPLPQYPPRVVSASQRASSPHRLPIRPTSPARLSSHISPPIMPITPDHAPPPLSLASSQLAPFSQPQDHVASPRLQQPLPSSPPASPVQPTPPVTDVFEEPSRTAQELPLPPFDIPSRNPQAPIDTTLQGLLSSSTAPRPEDDPPVYQIVQHQQQPRPDTPPTQNIPAPIPQGIPSEERQSTSQDTPQKRIRKKPFLSAFLSASSDPTVLAYACGMPDCWPNVNYATSSELAEHMRATHPALVDVLSDPDLKPYRCSLAGCNKSWKSLNGLQYHLQVSRDHFRQALASAPPVPTTESLPDDQEQRKGRKTHPCTFAGCKNVYKQLAGLRYHLKHGHPTDSPAQLDAVPPTLAKKVGERQARKGGLQVPMASSTSSTMITI